MLLPISHQILAACRAFVSLSKASLVSGRRKLNSNSILEIIIRLRCSVMLV